MANFYCLLSSIYLVQTFETKMVSFDGFSTKVVVLVESDSLRRQSIRFQMKKSSLCLQWILNLKKNVLQSLRMIKLIFQVF